MMGIVEVAALATSLARQLGISGLKTGGNALQRNVRFVARFEKKWGRIRGTRWTLNQRVPGSSPGAPTNKINLLAVPKPERTPKV
jgi:hypothetical protein